MRPVLLIDFGSTYTKLTAVDLDAEAVLGTAASYTTVQTDINEGLTKGLALLEEKTGKLEYTETFACSSAAGGLRMVTSGLVPELTSEAAKLASLGAGAKIVGGVTIGDCCRVGANAVVVQDMPPHSVAVCAPTRILQKEGLDNAFRVVIGGTAYISRDGRLVQAKK